MRNLLVFAALFPATAFAFSPDDMREEASFGAWTVVCESLDDMGGVTYTDCAATPTDGVFARGVDDGAMLIVPAGAAVQGLPVTPCDHGACSAVLDAQSMLDAFEAGVTIDGATIDPAGLSDALREVARLLR